MMVAQFSEGNVWGQVTHSYNGCGHDLVDHKGRARGQRWRQGRNMRPEARLGLGLDEMEQWKDHEGLVMGVLGMGEE